MFRYLKYPKNRDPNALFPHERIEKNKVYKLEDFRGIYDPAIKFNPHSSDDKDSLQGSFVASQAINAKEFYPIDVLEEDKMPQHHDYKFIPREEFQIPFFNDGIGSPIPPYWCVTEDDMVCMIDERRENPENNKYGLEETDKTAGIIIAKTASEDIEAKTDSSYKLTNQDRDWIRSRYAEYFPKTPAPTASLHSNAYPYIDSMISSSHTAQKSIERERFIYKGNGNVHIKPKDRLRLSKPRRVKRATDRFYRAIQGKTCNEQKPKDRESVRSERQKKETFIERNLWQYGMAV
jgi:hypothetical protein